MRRRTRRPASRWPCLAVGVAGCLPTAATAEGREIQSLYQAVTVLAVLVARLRRGADHGLRPALPAAAATTTRCRVQTPRKRRARDRLDGDPGRHRGDPLRRDRHRPDPRRQHRRPTPGVAVDVTAFRWGWTFEYPDEEVAVTGLGGPGEPGPTVVVPVGEPITLHAPTRTTSSTRSTIPQFLFKKDVIPGRVNTFQFTVEEPGDYGGQCAEFCGIYHSAMPFTSVPSSGRSTTPGSSEQRAAGPASPVAGGAHDRADDGPDLAHHDRPQADRAAVPDGGVRVLPARRPAGAGDPQRSSRCRGSSWSTRRATTSCSRCTARS